MTQYNAPFLQALATVLAPNATVTLNADVMEVSVAGNLVGHILVHGPDQWFAKRFETHVGGKRNEPYCSEESYGPYEQPAMAIRKLFYADNIPEVSIESGISSGEQESSFMNATLQSAGVTFAISVATNVDIPDYVLSKGEAAIAGYLEDLLSRAATLVPGLSFDVKVGPEDDPDE